MCFKNWGYISKVVRNKDCSPKLILLDKKNQADSNGFFYLKIDFESQILALFYRAALVRQFEKY